MKQSTVVIVFLLGLFFKVADAENSTQMYFLEFEFEKSVKSNVMGFLKLLTQIDNTNAVLSEFNSTTVSIKATSTISDEPCGILCNPSYKNTLEYQNKTQNYTKMLSEKFSTLKYFESLVITGFRSGSILADYTVQLLGPVSASALSKVAMNLNDTKLNTTGFVTITAPVNQPIDINSAAKITCTPQLNQPGLLNFVGSASNLLNDTKAWINPTDDSTDVSIKYLQTIENIISNANLTSNYSYNYENAKMQLCESTNMTGHCKSFNASADTTEKFVLFGFKNLHEILPKAIGNYSNTTILSVSIIDKTNVTGTSVKLWFESAKLRPPNHMMYCVYWDLDKKMWSSKDCIWGGADEPTLCTCTHNSAFTIMISKTSETLPYMEELTYAGLGTSIVSLLLCLIIEILVWDSVVKTPISNFRHVAQVNISFCLLLAHSAFLLTSKPEQIDQIWCSALTFIKHFFFLAVFFWMLCLSFVLLHQMIYIFDHLRKKVLIGLSITVGYAFPVIAVVVTILTFDGGAQDEYFSPKTCWLIYKGPLKGSIFAFVIPVGAIVFVNMFTLAVVIMKIATPAVSEAKVRDEKDVVRRMIKTIILLSPVLGITWLLGFFVLTIDLTTKPLAQIINYSFTILNSLQGFFILLTNYIGEKRVRDALLKRFKSKQSVQSKNEHLSKSSSSEKKK
ncbi:hypothetical protein DNTS_016245 [Danionella cerebrum]|uniref:G-protein coupled receptors family 2 profile 2 domain-containing protein n=1 Tax=Danionella cerebrum TaxID=2873325 RepID=A0A553Q0T0_9TELE|nr:hypothetical protein DNTS_016245 [Danionella translucida]